MGVVTTSLAERVTSIFDDLGYTVSGTEPRLRAERKWRVVDITLQPPESIPESGDFHCFVAPQGEASALYEEVRDVDPGYEWAVMRVDDEGDVEFLRPSHEGTDPIVT